MSLLAEQIEEMRATMIAGVEQEIHAADLVSTHFRRIDEIRQQGYVELAKAFSSLVVKPQPLYEEVRQPVGPPPMPNGAQIAYPQQNRTVTPPVAQQQPNNYAPNYAPQAYPQPNGYDSQAIDPNMYKGYYQPAQPPRNPTPAEQHRQVQPGEMQRILDGLRAQGYEG